MIPSQKRDTDAGIDLYSDSDITVNPGSYAIVHTGVAWDGKNILREEGEPDMHWFYSHNKPFLIVKSRSGLAFKNGIEATNAGVIDEDYTEEIMVKLYNYGDKPFVVHKGDRIAQVVFLYAPKVICAETDSIEQTGRGGFGASGLRG